MHTGPTTEARAAVKQEIASASRPPVPRPLLLPAAALAGGIALADLVGPLTGWSRHVAMALPVALLVAALLVPRLTQRGWALPLVTVFLVAAVGFDRFQLATSDPPEHVARHLTATPTLTRVAGRIVTPLVERPAERRNPFLPYEPPPRTTFVVALSALQTGDEPAPLSGNIRVTVEAAGLGLALGQQVELTGRIYRPRGPQNPGAFDWARWYRYQGLHAGLAVEGAEHVRVLAPPGGWWPRLVNALRSQARGLLFEPFAGHDEQAAVHLLDVMVLGQRSQADRALNDAFLRAGGMHFLAVSGFHVGVLAGVVWLLLRPLRVLGPASTAAVVSIVVVVYALVAEPNAPVLRATMMVVLVAAAWATNRPTSVLNSLALASLVLLLVNPLELFRAGFQLSFLMVVALVTLVPRLLRRFQRRPQLAPARAAPGIAAILLRRAGQGIVAAAAVCLVAWLVSLPLVLHHFGRFAPWGWLGSLVLLPLVVVVIVLGLVQMLTAPLPWLPLDALLRWMTGRLLDTVAWFEHLPAPVVESTSPPTALVLLTYLGALAVVAWPRSAAPLAPARTGRPWALVTPRTLVAINAAVVVGLGWLAWLILPGGTRGPGYVACVLAVGNGSATLLTTPARQAVVYDAGTIHNTDAGEVVARAARTFGVSELDAAITSHANTDHFSGLASLMQQMPVRRWIASPHVAGLAGDEPAVRKLLRGVPPALRPPDKVASGSRLDLGRSRFEVLWPPAVLDERWAPNDRSLVVRWTVAGRSLLLTGDADEDALAALLALEQRGGVNLRADVLVAPHHGAVVDKLTADFYAAVAPQTVIVSARRRRPKLDTLLAELLGPTLRVLVTGECGAIIVRIRDTGTLTIETPWAPAAR